MKVIHINESDFSEVEFDYPIHQVHLAESIIKLVNSPAPFIPSADGKKLSILAIDTISYFTPFEKDLGCGKYRITIEPLI